jgi:hypothetical protein
MKLKDALLSQYKADNLREVLSILERYAEHVGDAALAGVVLTQRARLSELERRFQFEGHSPEFRVEKGQLRAAIQMAFDAVDAEMDLGSVLGAQAHGPSRTKDHRLIWAAVGTVSVAAVLWYTLAQGREVTAAQDAPEKPRQEAPAAQSPVAHTSTAHPLPSAAKTEKKLLPSVAILLPQDAVISSDNMLITKILNIINEREWKCVIADSEARAQAHQWVLGMDLKNAPGPEKKVLDRVLRSWVFTLKLQAFEPGAASPCDVLTYTTTIDADRLDLATRQALGEFSKKIRPDNPVWECFK